MPYFSYSISTGSTFIPGNSSVVANLNWIGGKPTSISLTFVSSSVTNDVTVQYTLDDVQRVASSLVVWQFLSSAINNNSTTAFHLASTTWSDVGFLAQFLTPIAAVRLGCTTFASTGGLGSATLKVIQGEGW